jgi:hypothetical protein
MKTCKNCGYSTKENVYRCDRCGEAWSDDAVSEETISENKKWSKLRKVSLSFLIIPLIVIALLSIFTFGLAFMGNGTGAMVLFVITIEIVPYLCLLPFTGIILALVDLVIKGWSIASFVILISNTGIFIALTWVAYIKIYC